MSDKVVDNRTLVIKNFRNLAPFCVGTKDDINEDKAFLKLNRSLKREDLGGLAILVGVNNCGKSNVLDALEKYNTQDFTKDDFTDFTYANSVKPTISMNVANGKYGEIQNVERPIGTVKYRGTPFQVAYALFTEEESYQEYLKIADGIEPKKTHMPESLPRISYIGKIHEMLLNSDNNVKSKDFLKNLFFRRTYYGDVESVNVLQECVENGKYKGIHSTYNGRNTTYVLDNTPIIEIESKGTPMSDGLFSNINERKNDFIELNKYIGDDGIKTIMERLSPLHVEYQYDNPDDYIEDDFYKEYGYNLSDYVYRYKRKKICQNDFVCRPSEPNQFFLNLLDALKIDSDAIKNSYNDKKILRHRLENDMNRGLETISDQLNNLLNINEKKYRMEVKLERENMEFVLTYGAEIPLNIDRQSEGFRWLFDLFFNLLVTKDFYPGDIVLIDEFGNSLGFNTIKELTKKLREYGRENGLTFVLATQNPMAIDIMHLDEVRLVVPKDDGSSIIINEFDNFNKEKHDTVGPILNGLMVSRNFLRTENRRTVFVEGATDYFYLNSFSEAMRKRGKSIDIDFIPMNGLGKDRKDFEKLIKEIMSIEHQPIIFTDGDNQGEYFKSSAKKNNIVPSNISEIFDGKKTVVEDLFSEDDKKKLNIIHGRGEENESLGVFDNAACLSYKIPDIYDELDDETKKNFEKVIDYVMTQ